MRQQGVEGVAGDTAILGVGVEGDVEGGAFDVSVYGACGVGGEMPSEGGAAGSHPLIGDGAELTTAGGQGVQLIRENVLAARALQARRLPRRPAEPA